MAADTNNDRSITYRDAASEHVTVARELYDAERFVQANYLAGLAVECMLRAYRVRIDPEFDSRHDVDRLYKLAKFADIIPFHQVEEVTALLDEVIDLWSNDHRYLSTAALRRRWTKRRLYERVKGDFVKELTRRLVESASRIVAIGVARWKTSFRN